MPTLTRPMLPAARPASPATDDEILSHLRQEQRLAVQRLNGPTPDIRANAQAPRLEELAELREALGLRPGEMAPTGHPPAGAGYPS